MSASFEKSKSVPTPAKDAALLELKDLRKPHRIVHVDYIDLVLGVTSVFLSGFGLGLLFKVAGAG